jgi:hypothetical protein
MPYSKLQKTGVESKGHCYAMLDVKPRVQRMIEACLPHVQVIYDVFHYLPELFTGEPDMNSGNFSSKDIKYLRGFPLREILSEFSGIFARIFKTKPFCADFHNWKNFCAGN